MLKVYVEPPSHLSKAMFRVATALRRYAPAEIQVVEKPSNADLQVLHVIGVDALTFKSQAPEYAVLQYCGNRDGIWTDFWAGAAAVWSYYDLNTPLRHEGYFYHAPLGVDQAFQQPSPEFQRLIGVVTSGYVTGPGAEAIEEVVHAAYSAGLDVLHIGPIPVGLTRKLPSSWRNVQGVTDVQLADIYRHARWVSGLRHVEGFELPVIEGLACGVRPVVFDRADMREWYTDHAVFVPEDDDLEGRLFDIFSEAPAPVHMEERQAVLTKFDWSRLVGEFWHMVLEGRKRF